MSYKGYKVAIRKNDTQETRMYEVDFTDWENQYGTNDLFWWTEGNFGCDCNRGDSWHRAGGEPTEIEYPCGGDLFSALYAVLPDGSKIPIDEED
jgi:hypothetical protein